MSAVQRDTLEEIFHQTGASSQKFVGVQHDRERQALVEYLSRVMARADAWKHSEALLSEFGSLAGVLAALPSELPAEIRKELEIFSTLSANYWWSTLRGRELLTTHNLVRRYVLRTMQGYRTERLRVLYLDNANRLLADETLFEGGPRNVPIPLRRLVARCIEIEAVAVILIHNHPGGTARPSGSDIAETLRVSVALQTIEVTVLDHWIVAGDELVSLLELGLMQIKQP